MGFLLKNANLVDPQNGEILKRNVLINKGTIVSITEELPQEHNRVLDLAGKYLSPGLVDMHVHFRDPGQTHKENMKSGVTAAAAGGFTSVACMPNTSPVIDSVETLNYVLERSKHAGGCRVYPIAAVTVGEKGTELVDMEALYQGGAVAFSDDGHPVASDEIMQAAMQKAGDLGTFIIDHCEGSDMSTTVAVNEGVISQKLGVRGRPVSAELQVVERDIQLAERLQKHVHIAHVSAACAVEAIRKAKKRGVPVTAETCPQYFLLTEEEVLEHGSLACINPPLRTEEDRRAVLQGVVDGTLDCIVTDHAPHTLEEKALPIGQAPSGSSGLETSFAASYTALVSTGLLSLPEMIRRMSDIPAKILGIYHPLEAGSPADLMIFDPEERWTVDPSRFKSKGKNSVFTGKTLTGRVKLTICNGHITFREA